MHRERAVRAPSRQGVILLVVVSLLTLFSIVGLSFVMYADSEAKGANAFRVAHTQALSEVEPELLLSYFLGQFIYDVADTEPGVYSALRGHSLLRNMFGWNGTNATNNSTPFNGVGRLHEPIVFPQTGKTADGYDLVNYTCFRQRDGSLIDGFLRDPERLGKRTSLSATLGFFTGGLNAPYTYPDANNMYLAAVRADGTLLVPSFHRPFTSIDQHGNLRGFGPLSPSNPNWTAPDPMWKYMVMRPRPAEHLGFPLPEDDTGDVKNLTGAPGGNDSIWLDLGFPVQVTPEGRRYKPLFAPLIIDLDNRINLSVHGNAHGGQGNNRFHVSNQGWGRWEVNPGRLSPPNNPAAAAAWLKVLLGAGPLGGGAYGTDQQPGQAGQQAPLPYTPGVGPYPGHSRFPHFYSGVDYDARTSLRTPSTPPLMPGDRQRSLQTNPRLGFPFYPPATYGNYTGEVQDHPLLYNPFNPVTATGDRTFFKPSNMEAILRYSDTNSSAMTSEWFRMLDTNLNDPTGRMRRLVTTMSFAVDRPALTPYIWDRNDAGSYYGLRAPNLHPTGAAAGYPSLALRNPPVPPPANNSEFLANDWRGLPPAVRPAANRLPPYDTSFSPPRLPVIATLPENERVDVNRYLPDYPIIDPDTHRIRPGDFAQFQAAQQARAQLAHDIFNSLWRATGAADPQTIPVPQTSTQQTEQFNALRSLAQLAVNIVDYVDADDYCTPFLWLERGGIGATPQPYWVFGTELPRVLLNEAFVDYAPGVTPADPATFRVWAELTNPLRNDPTLHDNGAAQLFMPRARTGGGAVNQQYPIYRLLLCNNRTEAHLANPANVTGTPGTIPGPGNPAVDLVHKVVGGQDAIVDVDFSGPNPPSLLPGPYPEIPPGRPDPRFLLPQNPNPGVPQSPANGGHNRIYYLIGPEPLPGAAGGPDLTLQSDKMVYREPILAVDPTPPTIVLQRLACPHLPPNNIKQDGLPETDLWPFNPYLTVDFMADVQPFLRTAANAHSVGRRQPYEGFKTRMVSQSPVNPPPPPGQPSNTFFRPNVGETLPYDWLVHLDRQLISLPELFHVSAFKPHLLTQQFVEANGTKFKHVAPWLDPNTRLHRALEYLETRDRSAHMMTNGGVTYIRHIYPDSTPGRRHIVPASLQGVTQVTQGYGSIGIPWRIQPGSVLILDRGTDREEVVVVESLPDDTSFLAYCSKPHGNGGTSNLNITVVITGDRVPGRINVNTVWDGEILAALCDPQSANNFKLSQIYDYSPNYTPNTLFGDLMRSRTPGLTPAQRGIPSPMDRPFLPLSTGLTGLGNEQFPRGLDVLNDTVLRVGPNGSGLLFQPPVLDPPSSHPYQQMQMLTKTYSNLSTHSNVFAVWLTVGFFEVVDDSTRPVKLGPEIGRAENRQVRHRLFAIVDRSYQTDGSTDSPRVIDTTATQAASGPAPMTITAASLTNIHPGQALTISWQEMDPLGNPIPVSVNTTVGRVLPPDQFEVNLNRDIPVGALIRGNRTRANNAFGNPGPASGTSFRVRDNPGLVPYFSVIH